MITPFNTDLKKPENIYTSLKLRRNKRVLTQFLKIPLRFSHFLNG